MVDIFKSEKYSVLYLANGNKTLKIVEEGP